MVLQGPVEVASPWPRKKKAAPARKARECRLLLWRQCCVYVCVCICVGIAKGRY